MRSASDPARSSSWLATSTVAPDATAWRSTASSSSRPAASRPACGSSSSHSSARRATRHGERRPPPLPRRQLAHRRPASRPSTPSVPSRRRPRRVGGPDGRAPERHVLAHRQIVVEAVAVPEQPDPRPHAGAVATGRVRRSSRRAAFDRQQSGTQSQQPGLAGPLGPRSSTISPRSTRRVAPAAPGTRRAWPRHRSVRRPSRRHPLRRARRRAARRRRLRTREHAIGPPMDFAKTVGPPIRGHPIRAVASVDDVHHRHHDRCAGPRPRGRERPRRSWSVRVASR